MRSRGPSAAFRTFVFCDPLDVSFFSSLATRCCFSVSDPGVKLRGYFSLALSFLKLGSLVAQREENNGYQKDDSSIARTRD